MRCAHCDKRCRLAGSTVALLAGQPVAFCSLACFEAFIAEGRAAELLKSEIFEESEA